MNHQAASRAPAPPGALGRRFLLNRPATGRTCTGPQPPPRSTDDEVVANRASAIATAWLRLLAPPRCPGCDTWLRADQPWFCAACLPLLERVAESERPPRPGAAVFLYGGPLADAILRLKYAGRTELAPVLGALLAEAALPYAGAIDRVVAVPLHPSRLRERGYNQSALLALPVARALGVPLDCACLRRVRPTREQASLVRARRADNVRGAFAPRAGLERQRVLVIDDVRTTGATLAAAAQVLSNAGCREVRTLALARTEA
jgi:ComF family protein